MRSGGRSKSGERQPVLHGSERGGTELLCAVLVFTAAENEQAHRVSLRSKILSLELGVVMATRQQIGALKELPGVLGHRAPSCKSYACFESAT